MRQLVATSRPDLLARVDELAGTDVFARCDEGTRFLQPALYCASRALHDGRDLPGDLYAGHSLGEIGALVAAAAIDEVDGLRLVLVRGELMQSAAERLARGRMLAVAVGVAEAEALATAHGLVVANDNSPSQTVLSGAARAVDAAYAAARGRGLKATRLPVPGAFHSPALLEVQPAFATVLDSVEVDDDAARRVYSCVTAAPFDDVRRRLADALSSPVRWREVVLALAAAGVDEFVDVGPGRVLARLVDATLGPRPGHAGEMARA